MPWSLLVWPLLESIIRAPTPHCFVNDEDYPASRTFGEFPPDVQALLTSIVRKREPSLTALRNKKNVRSDDVLAILNNDLQKGGFGSSPRRFELQSKAFEVDRFDVKHRVDLEVEKGRVILGNQVYLDLFKFHAIPDVRYGAIILPTVSREESEAPFSSVSAILDLVFEDSRHRLAFEGALLIGY